MAEFVGAFPSSLALDDRNNIVREAEAYVYDVNDANLASPLPITDLQGVPFTGGKLVASNGIFPQFRTPTGVLEVYVKSGERVTYLTDVSVPAKAAVEAAGVASESAASASQDRVLAQSASGEAVDAAARAEAVGSTNDDITGTLIRTKGTKTEAAVSAAVGEVLSSALPGFAAIGVRGDSIARGEGVSDFGADGSTSVQKFTAKLPAAVEAEVTNLSGVTVLASGTSGQTTGQNRAGLQAWLLANRPREVVLLKSVNDARVDRPETPALTDRYMRQMVTICRMAGVRPIVVTSGPVDPATFNNPALIDYSTVMEARASNALLRAMGAELGVTVADIEAAFGAADIVARPYAGLFDLADGLHPNNNGHTGWATVIARAIAGLPQGAVGSNPSPYATLVSDAFNRADTTAGLGSADTGQAWTTGADWGVIGNKAYAVTPADNERALIDCGQAVHEAHVTVSNPGGRVTAGVIYGGTDASNYYLASLDVLDNTRTTGTLSVFKCVAGVYTLLHSSTISGLTPDQPVRISGARRGVGAHRISVNGVGVKALTDSSIVGGTRCGMRQANATPLRFDSFLVTT
ncbi:SGNH/GDSL hydrolase family protein [Microbacterium sp. BDGP8]|uniref:SGNH/GDSL hydrolase family protein n=1 Tax=Microbacterium sp. BDGP8 TaxID=3035531 RepID=UPI00249F5F66|nr:SGNH/GDSL hydrolase family protein [Microbacterium sp. BDGP8]WHE35136.1 SGNH/GDSL hydrolase family protein [Microbacterium sp. BDGP8]